MALIILPIVVSGAVAKICWDDIHSNTEEEYCEDCGLEWVLFFLTALLGVLSIVLFYVYLI